MGERGSRRLEMMSSLAIGDEPSSESPEREAVHLMLAQDAILCILFRLERGLQTWNQGSALEEGSSPIWATGPGLRTKV